MLKKVMKFTFLFFGFTFLLFSIFVSLMFYSNIGFFKDLREIYVETSMTTLSHQYLATTFISKQEIDRIMKKNTVPVQTVKSDVSEIKLEDEETKVEDIKDPEPEIQEIDIAETTYKGKMLIVRDSSRVKLAVSKRIRKFGEKLEDMISDENAVGGMNASGFGDPEGKGNGGIPVGIVIKDGKIVYSDRSSSFPIIGFNTENVLVIGRYKRKEIEKLNLRDAVSFTPFLIVNGEPQIKNGNGGWGIQPRTAIGQTKDGKVLMLVIDGRQVSSIGITLKDMQNILLKYGAYNAANLDGGSSTVMYYMGKLLNKPCSIKGERFLPDAFIIK